MFFLSCKDSLCRGPGLVSMATSLMVIKAAVAGTQCDWANGKARPVSKIWIWKVIVMSLPLKRSLRMQYRW